MTNVPRFPNFPETAVDTLDRLPMFRISEIPTKGWFATRAGEPLPALLRCSSATRAPLVNHFAVFTTTLTPLTFVPYHRA